MLIALSEKGYLIQFLEYVTRELQGNPGLIKKEALMLAIGSLSEEIKKFESVSNNIESLLHLFIFQEFESHIGFLRSRACWVYGQLANCSFNHKEHKLGVLHKICKSMQDPALPVKIEAATALPKILVWDESKENVSGEVSALLHIYKDIMNEIDSEELIEALENIVSQFSTEIIPFAIELIEHLVNSFLRLIEKGDGEEYDNSIAGSSVLSTLYKIIDVLEDRAQDLVKASILLKPIFDYCFTFKGAEYFEDALHILSCLLYFTPQEALPNMCVYVEYLKVSVLGNSDTKPYALEHAEEMFSVFANYISKYSQSLPDLNIFFEIASSFLRKDDEEEVVIGCKILIAILENRKGLIDNAIPTIIQLAHQYTKNSSKKVKIVGCEVICVCL